MHAVLVYKRLHGSAPAYITDELCQGADVEDRRRLRSRSSLIVSRTRLSTVGAWPSFSGCRCSRLEQSAWSCHFRTFRSCLPVSAQVKTHLFNISYPSSCDCTVPAQWRLVGHYNRSSLYLLCNLHDVIMIVLLKHAHVMMWVTSLIGTKSSSSNKVLF